MKHDKYLQKQLDEGLGLEISVFPIKYYSFYKACNFALQRVCWYSFNKNYFLFSAHKDKNLQKIKYFSFEQFCMK